MYVIHAFEKAEEELFAGASVSLPIGHHWPGPNRGTDDPSAQGPHSLRQSFYSPLSHMSPQRLPDTA